MVVYILSIDGDKTAWANWKDNEDVSGTLKFMKDNDVKKVETDIYNVSISKFDVDVNTFGALEQLFTNNKIKHGKKNWQIVNSKNHNDCDYIFKNKNIKPKYKYVTNSLTCKWYLKQGRRCKINGLRNGYCFLHDNTYIYNPDGIQIPESPGDIMPCTNTSKRKFVPTNVSQLEDVFLYSLDYIYNKNKYTIEKVYVTYAILKLKDKFIDEELFVWNSIGDKKESPGILINKIFTFRDFECDERGVVDLCNDSYYCKDCFENEYSTFIESLDPTES